MRVAVFCGSSRRAARPHLDAAAALGSELAARHHTVVYGGGRTGLMGALADAALAAGGRVLGVILREFIDQDVHHLGVEEMYSVDDMRLRKAGLDERADAFVALPGGFGTLEELTEVLSLRKLGHHHRPVVLVNVNGFFDALLAQVARAVEDGLEGAAEGALLGVARHAAEAVDLCERGAATGG